MKKFTLSPLKPIKDKNLRYQTAVSSNLGSSRKYSQVYSHVTSQVNKSDESVRLIDKSSNADASMH